MKKFLLLLTISLLSTICSAQTATPTPSRIMAWFTVPVVYHTPCPANVFVPYHFYFGSVTVGAYCVETVNAGTALLWVKIPDWQIQALSTTATCTFLSLDPRSCASVQQAIAAQKILNKAKSMGETEVRTNNAFVY